MFITAVCGWNTITQEQVFMKAMLHTARNTSV